MLRDKTHSAAYCDGCAIIAVRAAAAAALYLYNKNIMEPVASIPIPGGRSLRPVKNSEKSFDKVADQNFFPIFTGQTTPLTKLSP